MANEKAIRLIFFFGVFAVMAAWEVLSPRRSLMVSKPLRWVNNLAIVVLYTVVLRAVFPLLAIDMALIAEQRGWGLFNNIPMPAWMSVVAGVFMLDFIIYLQHVMFHTIPVFWRLHMMHHADLDIDLSTGLRFHPVEIFLSMGIKMAAVAAFGIPVLAVLIFEVILNATSMFNHSNVYLPLRFDRFLRLLVVTPDMHRVHHSVTIRETNSNFGFNFPWWDRLLGTYRPQPAAGHKGMTIGLAQFRDVKLQNVVRMLVLPFVGDPGRYAINQRGGEPAFKGR
jgi:sterol desaturase/sphingolipid hydroxylase (fatty acid hydroxylase superfamily)